MRLKTLEIKGFKSFANETVINFNEDVIGIVGPNGSGKSNVVDAIRWVLGEQKSSELRLDKMNSVIFNGTKKRKAGQFASVTLTFENTKNILPTEYASVAITRILYASGESEYRLNGVTCRLKDITTLFMDTGIGSNSYAIIALGMVDDILNDKQNSRRAMFEQAAGVSKYKQRKNETLNKLASTEEDLNRIEDLLFEIDSNLKTLEKQAKRTQRYFDLKAEYKELAIDLAVLKLSTFKDDYKKLEKQIEVETDKYRQIDVESIQLEANIEKEKKNNVENEQLLSERQRELNSIVGRIRGTENQKGLSQQRKSFIVQNVQKMTEQIQTLKSKQTQLDEDIDYYRTEINQERRLEQKLEEQLAGVKNNLDDIRDNHGSLKAGLDEFLQKQQVIERDIIELEKQKAISNNQIENLKRDSQRIDDDTKGRREEIQQLTEKLKALETKESAQLTDIQVIERDEEQRLGDLDKANSQLDSLTKQLTETNRKLDQQKNEFKLTKSMVESLEGYPESIRFLSNDKTWKAPLLSDLIYVKEDFRTAIENYLEPYLNYYVVQSLEQAYAAIRLLSNAQKGKANFFVLDAFNDAQFETKGLVNARPAIDLIQADMQYQPLFNYLLFNVLIADTENLNDYAVNTEGVVYLTKSGAMSRRRFSISGGSVGLFEGKKIGRKKNLELLEKTIADTEGMAAGLNKELSQARSNISFLKNNDKKKDLTQLQEVINQTRQEKVFLQTRIDNFTTFIDEADNKKLDAGDRVNHLVKSIQDMDSQLVVRKRDAEAIKTQMADTDGSFRSVSDLMSQNSQAYNEKNIEFIRQQNKVSTLQGELNFRERQKQESENTIRQNTQTLAQSKEELEHVEDDLARFETDLQEGYKQRREHETHLNAFEQGYFQKKNAINKMEDDLRKYNRQRQDMQLLINNLKDKFSDLKIQITSIGERLQVEFNMSVNDVINEKPKEGLNRDELERKVANQKRQLDTFGEINPLAVEAYNEMKERYDTINTQRNDIVGAKEDLLLTMKEIEETATAQFMEAFNTVRLYFIDVFKSLFFEEDTADLILTDPTNPLESGIQIIAKPKGKRPQSIAQLSGGEKTLTATALLFALYLYKPAPFCIFDEVDAPLDDANIEKFNKIIKKFSKDSQFIIVTHNKATMAAVDVIYGVHMPEQGVSQVTAVDFRMLGNTTEFVATAA
jgi:chromosome segregation protein